MNGTPRIVCPHGNVIVEGNQPLLRGCAQCEQDEENELDAVKGDLW